VKKKKKRINCPNLFSQIVNSYSKDIITEISSATKNEIDTFLSLLSVKPVLAFDYINCWLILRKISPLSEENLKTLAQSVTILLSPSTEKKEES